MPAPKVHMVRYYGAYSNRARKLYRSADESVAVRWPGGWGSWPQTDQNPGRAAWMWNRLAALQLHRRLGSPAALPRCEYRRIVPVSVSCRLLIPESHRREFPERVAVRRREPPEISEAEADRHLRNRCGCRISGDQGLVGRLHPAPRQPAHRPLPEHPAKIAEQRSLGSATCSRYLCDRYGPGEMQLQELPRTLDGEVSRARRRGRLQGD